MKVSVVIPAYNAASFIAKTLESVLGQTFDVAGELELLVVDDGSTDRTCEVVSSAGPPVNLVSGPRRGVSQARNEGVRRSIGEYIAFLDHDDLWEPGKIRRQVELLDSHPSVKLVFTQATVEENGAVKELIPELPEPKAFLAKAYENLVHWNYIPMSAVMVRRSALAELPGMPERGPFDPRYRLSEDWDLWLRMTSNAAEGSVAFISEPLTRYMIVAGRATERVADLRLEDISIFREQLRAHPWLASSDPRRCRATLYRLQEEAGYWLLREGRREEARRLLSAAWWVRPVSLKPLGYLIASLLSRRAAGQAGP